MIEQKNIPSLRFPEFEGMWNDLIISDIANKITDGTHDTPKPISNGASYITAIHVKDGFIDFDNCYYLSQDEHDKIYNRCNPSKGDLLMVNIGAGTATSAMVNVDFEFSLKNVALIKPNNNLIDSSFFAQIQRRNSSRLRHQISSGGAQPFLSLKAIGKLKLIAPDALVEQQKIASFLTSVDIKIDLLSKKKSLLERYKKGVMLQIFSQEIRFKDKNGKDFPDWEEKYYNEIYSFYTTNSFSRDNLNYNEGEVLNLHYGDIHTKFSTLFDLDNELVPFVNNSINLDKVKDENFCIEGDLVIADASEDYADIGKTIEIINIGSKKVLAGLHTFLARPNKLKMAKGFAGYMLQIWKVRKQVMKIAQGTKVLGLATSRLGKVELEIPCYEEQMHIARFLGAIDSKIDLVKTQLENTQQFKKGLLQQMFV